MYVCTARRSVIYPIIKGQVSGSDDDDDGGGGGGGRPKRRETIQYIIILRNIVYSQNVRYF